MSLTAPFTNAMRLGQGFNTYTQELRLEGAVEITVLIPVRETNKGNDINSAPASQEPLPPAPVTPIVPTSPPPPPKNEVATPPTAKHPHLDELKDVAKSLHLFPSSDGASSEGAARVQSGPVIPAPVTPELKDSANAQKAKKDEVTLLNSASDAPLPFFLPKAAGYNSSQSVTYSARSIDNMSDIMEALNISASASIKYGTISGNASAGFVNENKVLNSELNYVVTVKVNNNDNVQPINMEFKGIDDLQAEDFTEVFGDSFISGFYEGGEFAAIISVEVHDKSKLKHVKEALDVTLNIGPSPLAVGAGESFDKVNSSVLRDTAMTISVNWSGGGEIKKPEVPWSLQSVIQIANAFPTMVAHCPAKTTAILSRYTSLRSFQVYKYQQIKLEKASTGKKPIKSWSSKNLILNYAPCSIYTADLWDAYIEYKNLWKRIDYIMSDMTRWKAREPPKVASAKGPSAAVQSNVVPSTSSTRTTSSQAGPTAPTSIRTVSQLAILQTPTSPLSAPPIPASQTHNQEDEDIEIDTDLSRAETFQIHNPNVKPAFDLNLLNSSCEPIPLEPTALNEARLWCREAMTLITEEASRLVNHPELAYAHFDEATQRTRMKRPNYAYPENLKNRLPIFVRNDAKDDEFSHDTLIRKLMSFKKGNRELYALLIGPTPSPHRTQVPFISLDLNESNDWNNPILGLSIHAYQHRKLLPSKFSIDADNAIGAIGFRFTQDAHKEDKTPEECMHWEGRWPSKEEFREDYDKFRTLPKDILAKDIAKIEIYYLRTTGHIAAMDFYTPESPLPCLSWKQWHSRGREPSGLAKEVNKPHGAGNWEFIGLMGYFDESFWPGVSKSQVLSRVSGIWREA